MDLKARKLSIISRILKTDDPEILESIDQLLVLGGQCEPALHGIEPLPFSTSIPINSDPEIQDLQQSIDAIFQMPVQKESKENTPGEG